MSLPQIRSIGGQEYLFSLGLAMRDFISARKNLSVTWSSWRKIWGWTTLKLAFYFIFVYSFDIYHRQFVNGYIGYLWHLERWSLFWNWFFKLQLEFNFWELTFSAGVIVFLIGVNGYGPSTGWKWINKEYDSWLRRTEAGDSYGSWWSIVMCYWKAFLLTFLATYVSFDMGLFFRSWGGKGVISFIDSIYYCQSVLIFIKQSRGCWLAK